MKVPWLLETILYNYIKNSKTLNLAQPRLIHSLAGLAPNRLPASAMDKSKKEKKIRKPLPRPKPAGPHSAIVGNRLAFAPLKKGTLKHVEQSLDDRLIL
jgi:hypothetical protein